jgi:N-acetylneuraminic acid mutarotase
MKSEQSVCECGDTGAASSRRKRPPLGPSFSAGDFRPNAEEPAAGPTIFRLATPRGGPPERGSPLEVYQTASNREGHLMQRRQFLHAGVAIFAGGAARAARPENAPLTPVLSSKAPFAQLSQGGATMDDLPMEGMAERAFDSVAPMGPQGRWIARASLPLARSEMAWGTALAGRLHVIGGYGQGRVDRPDHHVYDPELDQWFIAAPLPRGANHVAVVADGGRIYALGGFVAQNTDPVDGAYAYEAETNRWTTLAPLPRPRGAAAAVALDGLIHLIGGATAPKDERASIGWHEVYDPRANSWSRRKALPGARDHVGCVPYGGVIHVIGGRFNTFEFNTDLHHVYDPGRDQWDVRAPMPTIRSGIGLVVYRERLFAFGGEEGHFATGTKSPIIRAKVFGQVESYDPKSDTWQQHAPMITPRHAVGSAAIGDFIYVAGGGAMTGGSVQSAVNEAFTLDL